MVAESEVFVPAAFDKFAALFVGHVVPVSSPVVVAVMTEGVETATDEEHRDGESPRENLTEQEYPAPLPEAYRRKTARNGEDAVPKGCYGPSR